MEEVDELIPDRKVAREFNVTQRTLDEWTVDPALGFPPMLVIRRRRYRSRNQIEAFKAALVQRALAERTAAA